MTDTVNAGCGALVAQLAQDEVKVHFAGGPALVLTIGAGAKAPGHQVLHGTDTMQATRLGQALAARHSVREWSTMATGRYA
jgi:hypothetical protein